MYLAEVKAVAFAVISSGYRSQALLHTHSDQRYIRRYGIHEHYLYPCWVRVDLYTAGDETRLQIFGSASALGALCISWLYSARGKYSSNTSSFFLAATNRNTKKNYFLIFNFYFFKELIFKGFHVVPCVKSREEQKIEEVLL